MNGQLSAACAATLGADSRQKVLKRSMLKHCGAAQHAQRTSSGNSFLLEEQHLGLSSAQSLSLQKSQTSRRATLPSSDTSM